MLTFQGLLPREKLYYRINFWAYMIYSSVAVVIFCFPANWVWGQQGWLKSLGVVDLGGAGPVFIFGGFSGLNVEKNDNILRSSICN